MKDYRIKYYLNSEGGELIRTEYRMCKRDANVLRVVATFAQYYTIQSIRFAIDRYVTQVFVVLNKDLPSSENNPW